MTEGPEDFISLADDEILFFALTCDLFASHESPLMLESERSVDDFDAGAVFLRLEERELLNSTESGANADLADRLRTVGECRARISVTRRTSTGSEVQNFYVSDTDVVEYRKEDGLHLFGAPRSETALVVDLAQQFSLPFKNTGDSAHHVCGGTTLSFLCSHATSEARIIRNQCRWTRSFRTLTSRKRKLSECRTTIHGTRRFDRWRKTVP